MSLSQPKVVVTLDGTDLPLDRAKGIEVSYPDGDQGGTATVRFAKGFVSQTFPTFTTTSHLVIRMGYQGRAGCPVVFDSSKVGTTQLSLEGDKGAPADKLVATWRSRLNDRQTIAPSVDREVYRSGKAGLHGLMRFVAAKVGYTTLRTNIPNVTLPRETVFTPASGYYKTMLGFLAPMDPLVFADDVHNILYVYWLDSAIPGSPATIGVRKLQSASIAKDTRAIVNQAIMRFIPQGRDGGGRYTCGSPSNTQTDGTGRLVRTSLEACDPAVDLGSRTLGDLESVRSTIVESTDEEGERISTQTDFYVFSDEREVKFRLSQTTYAKPESGPQEKVAYTSTDYLFLPGTNFEVIAGTRTRSEGMVNLPGVGRTYREDLKRSSTQIVSGQFTNEPGVWQELYSVTRERGLMLFPDRVPLELATRNDAVDVSAATFQEAHLGRLRKVTRALTEIGSSHLGYQTVEVDYTHDPPRIKTGEDEESLGRQPTRDDAGKPVEELIQDLDSIDNPLIGAREAVTIDGTWIGSDTESIDGPGADTITGRDFCVHMAMALFRRSGKRVVSYPFNSTKLYTRLGRGSVVRLTQRAAANPHEYLLTGVTYKAEPVKGGGFVVSTAGATRRLEAGDVE